MDDSTPLKLQDNVLGCLLYADDLVILSNTKEVLQEILDKLDIYCNEWKLEINTDNQR